MKENYMEIDIQGTIDRLNMNGDMINRLIKMTLTGDLLDKAKSSFADKNIDEAKKDIHSIKGTAANVGLVGLSSLASEIELKLKENEYFDIELLDIMEEVWSQLKTDLNI